MAGIKLIFPVNWPFTKIAVIQPHTPCSVTVIQTQMRPWPLFLKIYSFQCFDVIIPTSDDYRHFHLIWNPMKFLHTRNNSCRLVMKRSPLDCQLFCKFPCEWVWILTHGFCTPLPPPPAAKSAWWAPQGMTTQKMDFPEPKLTTKGHQRHERHAKYVCMFVHMLEKRTRSEEMLLPVDCFILPVAN